MHDSNGTKCTNIHTDTHRVISRCGYESQGQLQVQQNTARTSTLRTRANLPSDMRWWWNCFKRSVSQVHSPFPTLCFHSVQTRIGRATFPRVWITQTNFCCCGFFWWVSLSTSKLNGVVGIVSVTRMPVVWWERLTFASCGCGNLFGNCKANSGFIVHADIHLARFLAEHLGNGIIWLGDALLCFWSHDRNLTRHFSRKNIVEQQLRSHFHGNPSN